NALIDGYGKDEALKWCIKPVINRVNEHQAAVACDGSESKILFMYVSDRMKDEISRNQAFDFIINELKLEVVNNSKATLYFSSIPDDVGVTVHKFDLQVGVRAF
ncbi:hypothetical protein, partial [Pontibacterium sp.]|uniref:hypothetical protein n=1 Tax=Pontibacterium sp. TaxID=2036026 RepID=UPI0035644C33